MKRLVNWIKSFIIKLKSWVLGILFVAMTIWGVLVAAQPEKHKIEGGIIAAVLIVALLTFWIIGISVITKPK